MLKDAESPRSSTHDGADQKLELVRKISALFCKVAKRRAERWTFDEAAHELDKQRRWNSEGYDWWLTWLESRSKAGEITLLDGNAQADEINAALRADRNWRSEFAPRLPSARQASERRAGRWDYVMDANAWWLADSIAPINAAMLLSRRNPNVEKIEDAETNSSDEMEPQDFRRLKNIFEGADKEPRTLKAWTAYARERGLKIHSWINEWEAWVQEVDARQLPGGSALVPPVTGVETESASGGGAEAVTEAPATNQTQKPECRLAKLRELGGNAKYQHGEWHFKGITALVASEKASGNRRSDTKTVRADLKAAAQAERDAKTAGHWQGLA